MSLKDKVLGPKKYSVEDIVEELLRWTGIVFLFFGFSGFLMMILYPNMYGEDQAFQYGISFFYSYIMILGIFLILYHDKIIIRGHPT